MSSDEELDLQPKPKRQKRFKFKTFEERVADVEVDVYRSLGAKRAEPLPGCSSFFQEGLAKWRELNSAEHWLAAAAALNPLTSSLPQLVHHRDEIAAILLGCLRMEALLSLEPVLELTGTLARDLQGDYLPLLPRVLSALADLVDEGLDREPEQLQHLFACLSLICKHLCKLLASEAQLLALLKASQRLRHHRAEHVRALSAESLGFLFRQASGPAIRVGVKAALAEAVTRPTDERVHAAGALLAEAVTGVSHGLHSRAAAVLGPVLREGVLRPDDFKSAKSQAGGKLGQEAIQARVAAALSVCIEQLAQHLRRGKCGELWQLLLAEVDSRLEDLVAAQQRQQQLTAVAGADQPGEAAAPATGGKRGKKGSKVASKAAAAEAAVGAEAGPAAEAAAEEVAAAAASAARGLALLAQLVEHGRGCRVEAYEPLFKLAARLVKPEFLGGSSVGSGQQAVAAADDEQPGVAPLPYGASAVPADFQRPSLSAQVLRLLLALALSHAKVAGASEGPAALAKAAPAWAPAFVRAPAAELLPFMRRLISFPGGADVARPFSQQMLGALGRCLLAGELGEVCWPLLTDVCATLRPGATAGAAGVPILLTASGVGAQLAALVRGKLQSFDRQAAGGAAAAAEAWAALACLPHAAESAAQAAACCAALAAATEPSDEQAAEPGSDSSALLMLHCGALGAQAALLASAGEDSGKQVQSQLLPQALALVVRHPGNYHAVAAAAEVLQAASGSGAELSQQQLQELVPLLAPNLSAASQPLRRETLRVLCCFSQPAMRPPAGAEEPPKDAPPQPCDALQQLLVLESRQQGVDGGRPSVVALGRMRNYLEYRRLPDWLVPAVVHELLGVLHIRFAALWNPAHDALGMALDQYPAVAWPLMHRQLSAAQEAFLGGDCFARPAEASAAAAAAATGQQAAAPPLLGARFVAAAASGEEAAAGGSTDAAVRLNHILKAMAAANNSVVESKAREWVPLFLGFTAANPTAAATEDGGSNGAAGADGQPPAAAEDSEDEEDEEPAAGGNGPRQQQRHSGSGPLTGRAWRSGLREWLALLAGLKGARGMFQWEAVQRAVAVQLMDVDPAIQTGALKCLKVFKLKFLLPYLDRLLRLADNKTLRGELTAFPLAVSVTSLREDEGGSALLAEHRAGLVPLLVRLLFPKMRKRSGRLGGKGAPGSARAAILNFLASAEPHELRPLLELFLAPLSAAFVRPAGEAGQRELEALVGQDDPDAYRLIEGPWWGRCLGRQPGAWWLEHIDAAALNAEPLRKRIGYLNTLEDLLKHLGHRMQIFLPELLALAVCLLEGGVQPLIAEGAAAEAAAGTDAAAAAAAAAGDPVEGAKEVRGRSLRLAAAVLERFPTSCDYGFMWPRLLAATQPLLPRLAAESAADKAPPVIELAAALAASQHLVPVLADGASAAIPAAAARQLAAEPPLPPVEVQPCGEAWAAGGLRLGSALLAHCIAALSASRCSEPSRIAMLGALESIFDLPDPLPQQVLGPHMPALLQGLQSIVVAVWQQGPGGGRSATAGRKGGRGRGGSGSGQPAGPRTGTASRALAILELVGSRVASWEAAQQLTGALLPLLQPREGAGGRRKQRRGDELLVSRTLAVLAALWSRLPGAELEQRPQAGEQLLTVAAVLAPLAGSLEGRDSRQALCAAYSSVAGLLTELAEPAALLSELNALSTTEIDELDYERRMAAYSRLIPAAWQPLTLRQAAPLLHTCLHDLRNADDLALRHAASQALSRFIEGAAAATEAAEAAGASEAAAAQEGGSLLSAAQRVLFPQLKRGLPAPNLAVRQEHLSLLRQLVLAFPDHYAELTILTDTDAEVDFLLNVAHIQLHRRARALVRLTKLLKRASEDAATPSPLGVGTLVGVVQPLLLQMVVEGKGGEEGSGGHELKQADKDRGANVTDAAVVALGAVAGALPWVQYQQLLGQHLRLMKRHADDTASKAVIRSVCVILDAFHFPLPAELDEEQLAAEAAEAAALAAQEAAAERLAAAEAAAAEAAEGAEGRAGKRKDAEADEGEEAAEDEDMPDAAVAEAPVLDADVAAVPAQQVVPAGEVYRMLAKRVVPELQRIMVNKETVRAPVALAVVKVLQLLPAAAMRFQLPRTLQKVANLLRVRMQSTRDAARAVLVSMVKQLGPDYLPFVCEVLQSSCPPKGFTAHVLGYTVHAVIEAVAQVGQPGCLDDSLLMILPLMEADLFGEVAEAKEAVEFAGAYKEAKKCRAYETYQLLAGLITFGERAAELLTTVQSRLGEASQPKTRTKLGQLLQHAARGVLGNPTATAEDICMFFFATADSGLAAEEAARDKAKAASGAAVPTGRGGDDGGERAAALHQHLLVEFALSLLQGALRKGIINPRGPGADELLDPLLPLLVRALRSRHAPSVTTSLQALTLLMQSQLPGLQKTAADAGKAVTELLKRCPKTSHPIAQDCFKLLGGMLRQCERWAPSQGQLRFLVTWAFADLEETAGRQNAFHLLKAILARKLVLPEVYDLMNRVQELMVQSQAAPVRSACSSALLQFLLDYPLGEKRLQEHLQFLLTNLSYEHESGREAALDMLGVVLQKFPEPLVALWAEMVFLPLVARLVNDPSSKCRQMVGACLSTLLRRAPPARRDRLAQFCSQWLGGADARLTRAAAQALGILAEVEGSSFGRRVPALLPQLADVLASRAEQDAAAAEAAAVADPGEAEDLLAAAPGWQEAYYSLLLLQRVLEATAAQLAWAAGPAAQRCWGGAQRLLLHRHQWVRKASGRLVGAGLAAPAVGPPWLEAGGAGAAGALALSFFRQLDSEAADDALSGQAVKCLVFLCTTMHDDDAAAGRLPPPLKLSGAAAAAADEDGTNGHAAAEAEDVEQEEGSEDEEERAAGDEQQPGDEAAAAAGGGGSDSEGEEEAEEEAAEAGAADEVAAGSLTLHGLVRRMVRLADDKTYARQQQRGIALRFIAAVASRLGSQRVLPYLPLLMRPLYRITEPGAAGNPEEVTSLADEIVAHLRTLVGADAMLAAYNQAREAVRRQRGERKRKAALQTLVDPEAAAKRKMRKQQRKASGKRKQMEHVKRLRAAGVAVKNKRARMEGQRGGGGRRGRD